MTTIGWDEGIHYIPVFKEILDLSLAIESEGRLGAQ